MKKALFFISFFFLKIWGNDFAYISSYSQNVGDDIQTIAAKQFLPNEAFNINREMIGELEHHEALFTIMNGWFMSTHSHYWDYPFPPPQKSWPPSSSICPLLISIHFIPEFLPTVLAKDKIKYLAKWGPVGARDYFTLRYLQKCGVPAYFSGCLTLTLNNECNTREDVVYIVDLDEKSEEYVRAHTKTRIKKISHVKKFLPFYTHTQRLEYAQNILEKYKRAKCVITTRLHAALPCLAYKTPVLLMHSSPSPERFDGLEELTHHGTTEDLVHNLLAYDFDNPPPNPDHYLPLREKLIQIVTSWVEKNKNCK